MIVIKNNIIPFKGFVAINLFGIVFTRKDVSEMVLNHEKIHTKQMIEMGFVFFYVWNLIEWIIRLFKKGNAYRNISFEREAYYYDTDLYYCSIRKHYSWLKYLV